MLVTFTCHSYENITFFGDIAKRLLVMMGQSGVVPGAILRDDVPAALQQLQQALGQNKTNPLKTSSDDEDEPQVSMTHRALPLIELLKAAARDHCDVLWQ